MILKRFLYCLDSIDDNLLEFDDINEVDNKAFMFDTTIDAVKFNEEIDCIKESAFEECKELKVAILGDNSVVDSVSYWPFNAVVIAKTEQSSKDKKDKDKNKDKDKEKDKEGSLSIQTKAFYNCSKLHSVIFPDDKIITIEKDAFTGCTALRAVVFGSGKAEIRGQSFIGCNNVSFVCPKDSDAERFAREYGIKIINV